MPAHKGLKTKPNKKKMVGSILNKQLTVGEKKINISNLLNQSINIQHVVQGYRGVMTKESEEIKTEKRQLAAVVDLPEITMCVTTLSLACWEPFQKPVSCMLYN